MDKISNDRITDRADQIPLLLNREGHSPRNFMAHYPGDELGCDPLGGCKVHIKAAHCALPSMDFDNIKREPGQKYGFLYGGLLAVGPIQMAMRQHMGRAQKLPHRKPEVAGEAQITPHS